MNTKQKTFHRNLQRQINGFRGSRVDLRIGTCHARVAERSAPHVTRTGRIAFARVRPSNRCSTKRVGYGAARARTARAAFTVLRSKPATRKAMLRRDARTLGIGTRRLKDGTWKVVVIVAVPRGSAKTEQTSDPFPDTASGRIRSQILTASNSARTQHGAGKLAAESCLNRNAQRWAEQLAERHQLQHQDLSDVFAECGGRGQVAENIAYSLLEHGAEMVQMWMDSPGHRQNLLNGDYTRIGVGAARSESGYWYGVQVFGTEKW